MSENIHHLSGNLLVGSSHFFVDTTNNRVGITTADPDAGLHVNSNAYVHTDFRVGTGIAMNVTGGRITAGSFEGDGSLLENVPGDSGSWVNGSSSNVHLATLTDKVGIGTVSPATYLHLSAKNSDPGATEGDNIGSHNLVEYLRFTSTSDSGDINAISAGFKLGEGDTSSSPVGRLDICANSYADGDNSYGSTPDVTVATFLGSGNVGIGTDEPECALDVQVSTEGSYIARFKNTSTGSDEDARIILECSDGGGEPHILFQSTDETNIHRWNVGTGSGITPNFYIQNDSSLNGGYNAFLIDHNGKVRIGSEDAAPQGQLHVSGGNSGDCHLIIEADTDNNAEGDNPKLVFVQDGGLIEGEIGMGNNYLAYRCLGSSGGHRFYVNEGAEHSGNDYNHLTTYSTKEALVITGEGDIGIGFNNPGTLGTHVYNGGRKIVHLMGWMYYGDNSGDNEIWVTGIGTSSSGEANHFLWRFSLNGAALYNVAYIHYISASYNDLRSFTGQHRAARIENIPPNDAHIYEGLIVVADTNLYESVNGDKRRGQAAITTNEAVPFLSLCKKAHDKRCFGVISASEDPDTREQRFGNFVSIHPKEAGDTFIFVNSLGEGGMWVTNVNGALESGDYITTSDVPGYGAKQNDDILHNYTVAKITMDCDFNPPTQPVEKVKKILGEVKYWVQTKYVEVSKEEYESLDENERTIEYIHSKPFYKKITKEDSLEEDDKHTELDIRMEMVNDVDENDQMMWEETDETEKAYKVRYLLPDGTQISEEEYTTRASMDEKVYIAAFVGCTYHCG